jgi:large subunit ribosomal protein L21
MYAIVKSGGLQYRVEEGTNIAVNKIVEAQAGQDVTLNDVLLLSDGEKVTVGKPLIDGASVTAKVVRQKRGEKLIVFKRKPKKGYKRKLGHRQYLTELQITKINA